MHTLPETSPRHYITGITALNVPLPEEGYGNWHFTEAFYGRGERAPKIFVAGDKEEWNTHAIFGDFGIYECAEKLKKLGVEVPAGQKVYVAGHYRAVLDMLYRCVKKEQFPHHLTIDAWFDSEEQKQVLLAKVKQMKNHLSSKEWHRVEEWLKTVS